MNGADVLFVKNSSFRPDPSHTEEEQDGAGDRGHGCGSVALVLGTGFTTELLGEWQGRICLAANLCVADVSKVAAPYNLVLADSYWR